MSTPAASSVATAATAATAAMGSSTSRSGVGRDALVISATLQDEVRVTVPERGSSSSSSVLDQNDDDRLGHEDLRALLLNITQEVLPVTECKIAFDAAPPHQLRVCGVRVRCGSAGAGAFWATCSELMAAGLALRVSFKTTAVTLTGLEVC